MPTYPTYKLGEVLSYEQPTNYIVESTEYDDSYPTPVLTAGKSFILGYTNETKGVFDKLPVIIFDDFTTASQFVDFKFKVKSSAMKILSCNKELANIKYMYYLMQITHIQSDTHKRYWISDYSKIPVNLPPLSTQQAIVTRIESLFAELDKGVEKLKNAQQQLKVYRQAVLNDLLPMDNSKWKYVPIKNLISTINNGYTPKSDKMHSVGDVQFLKVYNLTFDGTLNLEKDPVFIDRETHEKDLKRSMAYPNDVLINIVGPPLGKVSVIPNTGKEYNINQAMVLFRPNEKVESLFLSYYLQSPQVIAWLTATSKATAGQYNVKVTTCREIPFPMVEVTEQQRIVQEIETRLSACDEVEKNIAESLQQADALRQSILKKAFEGELV